MGVVRIELDERCLLSRLYRVRTPDESIQRTDIEVAHSKQARDSSVDAASNKPHSEIGSAKMKQIQGLTNFSNPKRIELFM